MAVACQQPSRVPAAVFKQLRDSLSMSWTADLELSFIS
jgi:hypothetical protein